MGGPNQDWGPRAHPKVYKSAPLMRWVGSGSKQTPLQIPFPFPVISRPFAQSSKRAPLVSIITIKLHRLYFTAGSNILTLHCCEHAGSRSTVEFTCAQQVDNGKVGGRRPAGRQLRERNLSDRAVPRLLWRCILWAET